MRLPNFTYLVPGDLHEALEILNTYGKQCSVLAGGTDLLVRMKQRLVTPTYVVSLKEVAELSYIMEEGGYVKIGARTPLAEILRAEVIKTKYPALTQAVGCIGAPSIQLYRGTMGGNLCQENRCQFYNQSAFFRGTRERCRKAGGKVCYAPGTHRGCRSVCQSDCAPVLIALGARVVLASKGGIRKLSLTEFYTGVGKAPRKVKPDEVMERIEIPLPGANSASGYRRLSYRSSIDYPVVSAAASVSAEDGRIVEARIAVGAMGSAPVLISDGAKDVVGAEIGDHNIVKKVAARAAEAVSASAVDNMLAPLDYRLSMVPVMVTRALKEALANISRA